MRRIANIDSNQVRLVRDIRAHGFSVAHTHMIGKGFPDIVIGGTMNCLRCGQPTIQNLLGEIKDPNKSPAKRALTPDEREFHDKWKGQILIVESVDDILLYAGRNF